MPSLSYPNLGGWGAYKTSETLNRYNSTLASVMKNFKIDVFLKKRLWSISCSVLLSKKRRFISQKMWETACFLYIQFSYISGGMGVCLTPLTPSTATPCPGTPPANSRCTKQFLSHPHDLQLFLSEGAELPTMAVALCKASLSPIGHLEVICEFQPHGNVNLYCLPDQGKYYIAQNSVYLHFILLGSPGNPILFFL